MTEITNVSADLLWELTREYILVAIQLQQMLMKWTIPGHQNAFLVKRRTGGGVQFSRDPLNLTNKHSRKYAGFVNDKAYGLTPGKDGSILALKKSKSANKPSKSTSSTSHGSGKSNRSFYKSVAGATAKQGYRADLRGEAVARASALKKANRPVKDSPTPKLRGKKALAKAAASKEDK
ncbi:MAG: hypothetical protein GOMPHAMPRED_002701 [Gomphillus americanus]|uniref:Ribosomal eL28/Mak16 domain-containing protein n=1 Tax=Gomphillus americanus TaxID=1940652 RepID=A0A8H3IJA5_9LECA|nr:MAG: hypothetical protein GOMPHAMPRED_002701 [Gomphillus americanus]